MRILCRDFGFSFVSQKGSHAKLRRRAAGKVVTTIVPLHRELARGTLIGILELGRIEEVDFLTAARK
ncbi:MAG: type II toxin-antitoxin system HicA family toxin [bacterium]|nr:type II toxin-antitoxin system HicA family toxin [bacterium]